MAGEKLFHVGVKALIANDDGKVLILEVDPDDLHGDKTPHADLPGGRINTGETVMQTLHREVQEETGITDITDIRFLTAVVSDIEFPISDTQMVGLTLFVYEVKAPAGSQIKVSDEHLSYEWVSIEEAAKRLEYKFTKEFSEKLLDAFGRVA